MTFWQRTQQAFGLDAQTVWYAGAIAWTFGCGLTLQLAALRLLPVQGYASFVLALGVGNVAAALAGAVQPVVATRIITREHFMPFALLRLIVFTACGWVVLTFLLARSLSMVLAALVMIQIPLHVALGIALGNLQARRAFLRIGICTFLWSCARLGGALLLNRWGWPATTSFISALPLALAVEVVVAGFCGGFRALDWRLASDAPALGQGYAVWGTIAWIMNADAVFARTLLNGSAAGAYAVALTIGQQPLYVAQPAATVLLPATLADAPMAQRQRLCIILALSGLVLLGALGGSVLLAKPLVTLLHGRPLPQAVALLPGYAGVGTLEATLLLLLTFSYALGVTRSPWVPLAVAGVGVFVALVYVHSAWMLLGLQGVCCGALVAWTFWRSWNATSINKFNEKQIC